MRRIKVALITHEFPPFIIGGIASHSYDLAFHLSKLGIETRVICGSPRGSASRTKLNRFLEIVRLPFLDYPPQFLWFQTSNHRQLRDLLYDCNVIHGVNPMSSFGLAYTERNSGRALITTHHLNELQTLKMYVQKPFSEITAGDLPINVLYYPLGEFIEKIWFRYADRIVVPGVSTLEFLKRILPERYTRKMKVIYNGISFEKINGIARESSNVGNLSQTLVCFGRLVSHKGVCQFVKGLDPVLSEFPNVEVKIFGKGPAYGKLLNIIRQKGIAKRVHLMDHVPYDELIRQINEATVVVLPTYLEIGPFIAALEAMACGKPVVLYDFSFNREYIRNMENGILAKPGDVQDLVIKVCHLLSDSDLRRSIGRNARDYVRNNHNWDQLASEYIEMYQEVLFS